MGETASANVIQQESFDDLEITKALALVDYIHSVLSNPIRREGNGSVLLSKMEADAFDWMLAECGNGLHTALKAVNA